METDEHVTRFLAAFEPTSGSLGPFPEWSAADTERLIGRDVPSFTKFVRATTRTSFNDGALRFLPPGRLRDWNGPAGWRAAWPQWADRLAVFATDWSGRQFGFDLGQSVGKEPQIAMLDMADGELMELTGASFSLFIGTEVVTHQDEVILASRYRRWLQDTHLAPSETECVGYVEPLFLGGADEFGNMNVTDMDVYVNLTGQLFAQVANVPVGTRIGSVRIS